MDPIVAHEAISFIHVRYEELKPIITIEVRTVIDDIIGGKRDALRVCVSLKKFFN